MTRTKAERLSNWVPVKVGCETVPAGVPALSLLLVPAGVPALSDEELPEKAGFETVYNQAGGIIAWERANLPVTQK